MKCLKFLFVKVCGPPCIILRITHDSKISLAKEIISNLSHAYVTECF